jgi:hypothetical protein
MCDCEKKNVKPTNYEKWLYTLYTTIVFVLVSNPYTYRLVNSILGNISDKRGCPTSFGFVVHTIVFMLVLRVIM